MELDLMYSTPERAHKLEHENRWEDAATMWRHMAKNHSVDEFQRSLYKDHAETCQRIVDANNMGDEYRRQVLEYAGPEPEVEDKTDSISWMAWYYKMSEVYNKMFRS